MGGCWRRKERCQSDEAGRRLNIGGEREKGLPCQVCSSKGYTWTHAWRKLHKNYKEAATFNITFYWCNAHGTRATRHYSASSSTLLQSSVTVPKTSLSLGDFMMLTLLDIRTEHLRIVADGSSH